MATDRARHRLDRWRLGRIEPLDLDIVRVPAGMSDVGFIASLACDGEYEYVVPDWIVYPAGRESDDPQLDSQWHHAVMQSRRAWEIGTGSPDVVVALVDTGVDTDHPDLQDARVCGYHSVGQCPFDCPEDECNEGGAVEDINGHGTATAGCAAAIGNNGLGVAGMGWNLSIMPVRASDQENGGAFHSDVLQGIVWAASHGARVVSVSFGCVEIPTNDEVGEYVMSKGGLLVWALGNAGINFDFESPHYITVGGTREDDTWYNGNFGPAMDVSAPARNIFTTKRGGTYSTFTGTSFAAPLVSGTLALMFSEFPDLTPRQAEEYLLESAVDLGPVGKDNRYGVGRVDAYRALVTAAVGGLPPATIISPPCEEEDGTLIQPDDPPTPREWPGVWARHYFIKDITGLPDFGSLKPFESMIVASIGTEEPRTTSRRQPPSAGRVYETTVYVDSSDAHLVVLRTDGFSRLLIGDRCVAMNEPGGDEAQTSLAAVWLDEGWHRLRLEYLNPSGPARVSVAIEPLHAHKHSPVADTGLRRASSAILRADWTLDGSLDAEDFFAYLESFGGADPRADLNTDGRVDADDFFAFLDLFTAG
ncbi:MAG: S8 family serine peptidase [Phycisphaeraceae bacterium]|nr:S8 family serine peptidase [Phycisphaeraceae bacterium]